jgi:hypothetical protein
VALRGALMKLPLGAGRFIDVFPRPWP